MTELSPAPSSIDKIKECLKDGKPKNISEISKIANLTWDTTKSTLKKLENLNMIFSNNKKYFINPKFIDSKTYFNLPLSNKEKEEINKYYNLIQKSSIKKTKQSPTAIQIYKVLSKLNREFKLKLPIGLYRYGDCPVLPFRCNYDYSIHEFDFDKEIETQTNNIIDDYKNITPRNLRKIHYHEIEQKSYQIKEEILDSLYKLNHTNITLELTQNIQSLIKELNTDNIPNEHINLMHDFLDILYQFKSRENKIKIQEYKEDIIDTFKDLWPLIATNYFKKAFENKYENKIINTCFNNKIREEKEIVLNQFFALSNIIRTTFDNPKVNKYFQKIKTKEPIKIKKLKEEELQTEEEQEDMLKKLGLD